MYLKVHIEPNGRHHTHVKAAFLASFGKQNKALYRFSLKFVPMHHPALKSADGAKSSDY